MFGWKSHIESFQFEDHKQVVSSKTYTYAFYKHIMLRHSCSICKYTNLQRPSDITIADFWGHEKTIPNINDNKGLSLVLLNTDKGLDLFNQIQTNLMVYPAELHNCLQPNLKHPTNPHPMRMKFERDYERKGLLYVMQKYSDLGWRYKIKNAYKKTRTLAGNILRFFKIK
jgi:hypothetical protein